VGHTSLAYRFPPVVLSAEARSWVRDSLGRLEQSHALYEDRPGLLHLCEVFLAHCCPPEPRVASLEVVTSFLYLVMYFADRARPKSMAQEAPAVLDALAGGEGGGREVPGVVSLAETIGARLNRALVVSAGSATSFLASFRVNLSAFVWAAAEPPSPADLAAHLDFRDESICAVAYLRLWGLLEGLSSAQETRGAFVFQGLERLSARVQALANDLRSVDRDRGEGTPNAILVWSRTAGADEEASKSAVRQLHDEALLRLEKAMADARRLLSRGFFGGDATPVGRYLDFIGSCTCGNEAAMQELDRRYDR